MMNAILEKVEEYITDNSMLSFGEHVVAGVSGGADSMCLLFVLMNLREKWGLTLHVVHINHGIRGFEAMRDQQFVENFCKDHDLLWKSFYEDIPAMAAREHLSEEEAGRIYRYQCFEQVAEAISDKNCKIAVAHNKNDVSETLLMNIFRGSGLRGLCGIPPVRSNIIRPLLCLERKEIEALLAEHSLQFCTDRTNFENDYTRNRLRNDILPYVTEHINVRAADNMYRLTQLASQACLYITKQQEAVYPQISQGNCLNAALLRQQDNLIVLEIIRRKIEETTGRRKDITQIHVEQAAALLDKQVGKMVNLPYGLTVIRGYDDLKFVIGDRELNRNYNMETLILEFPKDMGATKIYSLENPSLEVELTLISYKENQRIEQKQYTKWFDYDKIKNGLKLRHRCNGDYMVVDKSGSQKLLRRLMIDEKIPKEERESVVLVADGSHILWIIGGRISDAYKVTGQTKKILEIKIKGEE